MKERAVVIALVAAILKGADELGRSYALTNDGGTIWTEMNSETACQLASEIIDSAERMTDGKEAGPK